MSYGAGPWYDANYRYPSGSIGVYAIFNPAFREKLNGALTEEVKKAMTKALPRKGGKAHWQAECNRERYTLTTTTIS